MSTSGGTVTPEEEAVPIAESGAGIEEADRSWVRTYLARKTVNKAAYVRLHCELAAARPEFELLASRTGSEGDAWVTYGRDLLEMAEADLRRGAIEEAWRHLHTAKRFEVYGLEKLDEKSDADGEDGEDDPRSELEIRAAAVGEEALDALGGWRRRAVVGILCDEDEAIRGEITGAELRTASRILHEQYESVYMARGERQRQFNQLVLLGTLAGLSLLALTLVDWLWTATPGLTGVVAAFLEAPFGSTDIASPGFAVFMTIAGAMGASLFGMRSLRNRSLSTKVPQQINQLTVTGARGVIGAISALLFFFVLQTPLLHDGTILAQGVVTAPLMIVIGFAAGYTERMAPDVVATVASITESDEDDESNAT